MLTSPPVRVGPLFFNIHLSLSFWLLSGLFYSRLCRVWAGHREACVRIGRLLLLFNLQQQYSESAMQQYLCFICSLTGQIALLVFWPHVSCIDKTTSHFRTDQPSDKKIIC